VRGLPIVRIALAALLFGGLPAGCGHESPPPAARDAAPAQDPGAAAGEPGGLLGDFVVTYYWVEMERDYAGADDTALPAPSGRPLATVPRAFADRVCVEGTGVLRDGRVINIENCSSGFYCAGSKATVCFFPLDGARFPWGMGSNGNPLEPLRSIAVDNAIIPYGTPLYVKEWDGVAVPSVDGLGGFVHDGHFRADDVGNGIRGLHLDFFVGTPGMRRKLEEIFPSDVTRFHVYRRAAKR
jgi:3D (Asp-Asp-Asp) domain-containing protein